MMAYEEDEVSFNHVQLAPTWVDPSGWARAAVTYPSVHQVPYFYGHSPNIRVKEEDQDEHDWDSPPTAPYERSAFGPDNVLYASSTDYVRWDYDPDTPSPYEHGTSDGALSDSSPSVDEYDARTMSKGPASLINFSPAESLSPPSSPNPVAKVRPNELPCLHPGCTRTFKREYTRSVHMTTHIPKVRQRYACLIPGCRQEFSRRHDRFRHEVHVHHLETEWRCDGCGKYFAKEVTLGRHTCSDDD